MTGRFFGSLKYWSRASASSCFLPAQAQPTQPLGCSARPVPWSSIVDHCKASEQNCPRSALYSASTKFRGPAAQSQQQNTCRAGTRDQLHGRLLQHFRLSRPVPVPAQLLAVIAAVGPVARRQMDARKQEPAVRLIDAAAFLVAAALIATVDRAAMAARGIRTLRIAVARAGKGCPDRLYSSESHGCREAWLGSMAVRTASPGMVMACQYGDASHTSNTCVPKGSCKRTEERNGSAVKQGQRLGRVYVLGRRDWFCGITWTVHRLMVCEAPYIWRQA